ncbi:uracil-DNA glycosylase family protein [Demequina sp.]|uniref:uracil-DNA glycosylase family protein n=1 Tax=Demequina sp. TaxID=2050685 RepID=UPI003D0E2A65
MARPIPAAAETLIGYQARVEWMGREILTLADLWPREVRAAIVGLNPAPPSVAAGHYYQGRLGLPQMRRLAAVGVFDLADDARTYEVQALNAGVGLTDLVKRPTVGEKDLAPAEIEYGRAILLEKLAVHRPPVVICVFRHVVRALLGAEGAPGIQPNSTPWGGSVFRMPGPFSPKEAVAPVMAELREVLSHP